jgi:hypothetical protein
VAKRRSKQIVPKLCDPSTKLGPVIEATVIAYTSPHRLKEPLHVRRCLVWALAGRMSDVFPRRKSDHGMLEGVQLRARPKRADLPSYRPRLGPCRWRTHYCDVLFCSKARQRVRIVPLRTLTEPARRKGGAEIPSGAISPLIAPNGAARRCGRLLPFGPAFGAAAPSPSWLVLLRVCSGLATHPRAVGRKVLQRMAGLWRTRSRSDGSVMQL